MDWKEELHQMLNKGCSDSDIEDYIDNHPELNGKEIWDFVYEFGAPEGCKGCKHIQMTGMMPCIRCKRRDTLKDYYEPRT